MDDLTLVRVAFLSACAGALAYLAWYPQATIERLRRFFFEPSSAGNLGILRILVFGTLFRDALANAAPWYASVPESFRHLPSGWQWLDAGVAAALPHAAAARSLLILACALSCVGLGTRVSSAVAALLAVFVFGVPNFYFKISHGEHVPVLCALVLAASPAGDTWSLDALLRRWRGLPSPAPGAAHVVPVRFCWLLVGSMYLFPGMWKLWDGGDLWVTGARLKAEIYEKWAHTPEFYPLVRIDRSPAILALLGTWTLLFEIGFFFAMFSRPWRAFAAVQAMGFHLGVGLVMGIEFDPIFPLIALIDFPQILELRPLRPLVARLRPRWTPLAAWLRARLSSGPPAGRPPQTMPTPAPASIERSARATAAPFVVGLVLLLSMFYTGLAPVDTWPVSVYPRFGGRGVKLQRKASRLEFALRIPDGSERELRNVRFDPLEDTAAVYRLTRAVTRGDEDKRRRYGALVARIVRENVDAVPVGSTLLVYSSEFPIEPEERKGARVERKLVAEVPL